MYRKCVTEISVQHQKQIESSLLELMGKMPYEDISVTALCQAAGVSRRIFYHLFGSKTDALHALIDHRILDMESYRPDIQDQAERFFRYWKEQKALLDVLVGSPLASLLLERLIESVLNEDYEVRSWLKTQEGQFGKDLIIFNLTGIMGLVYSWHYSGYDRTPEQMAELTARLVTSADSWNRKSL